MHCYLIVHQRKLGPCSPAQGMSEIRTHRKILDGCDAKEIERVLHEKESQIRHDTLGAIPGISRDNDPDLVITVISMTYLGEK